MKLWTWQFVLKLVSPHFCIFPANPQNISLLPLFYSRINKIKSFLELKFVLLFKLLHFHSGNYTKLDIDISWLQVAPGLFFSITNLPVWHFFQAGNHKEVIANSGGPKEKWRIALKKKSSSSTLEGAQESYKCSDNTGRS